MSFIKANEATLEEVRITAEANELKREIEMSTNTAVTFYSNLLHLREINEKFELKVDFLVMTSNYNFNVDLIIFKLKK